MNREEILKDYTVNAQGVITSPGKFEGEMLYAPYFYDMLLNGDGDPMYADPPEDISDEDMDSWEMVDDLLYTSVEVEDGDRAQFPELGPDTVEVRVYESDSGFVHIEEV